MSVIDGLNAPNTAPPTSAGLGGQVLDQKAFLRLLTTQLTTQDPFNPMDNTQMVAQMAQFSQVAGITEMNQSLKTLIGSLGGSDVSSWIGRAMMVQGDVVAPLVDGTYAGEISLPENADDVSVSFVDQNGNTVHTIALGARHQGAAAFAWNGKNEAGQTIADGPLKVVVTARAGTKDLSPTVATWTSILGIQSPGKGGEARLVTPLGLLEPQDAIRIA